MKFWVLGLVVCVLLSFSVSAGWVLQETADSVFGSGNWDVFAKTHDDNYSSFGTPGSVGVANGYYNYTNITLINNSDVIIWQVKDGNGTVNLTLPAGCKLGVLQYKVFSYLDGVSTEGVEWSCFNYSSSAYIKLRDIEHGAPTVYADTYEEGVFFNYTAPVVPVPSVQDQTFQFLGAYAAIGIGLILFWTLLAAGKKKRVM